MRPVIAAGLLVLGALQAAVQPQTLTFEVISGQTRTQPTTPPQPLVATGLIMGRVIDPATDRPVAGAIVMISGGMQAPPVPVPPGGTRPAPPPPPPRYLTDSEGRFAFRHLVRGSYTVSATRPGYADGAHGRLRANGPTRPIVIGDGERIGDVVIRLFKYGTISGTVIDDAGEPVVGVSLRGFRRVLSAGRRVLTPFGGNVVTDDRGMYRVANLTPGDYVVSVPMTSTTMPSDFTPDQRSSPNFELTMFAPGGGGFSYGGAGRQLTPDGRFLLQSGNANSGSAGVIDAADGRLRTSPTIYYPSVRAIAQAEIIAIGSGEDRAGVDIVLPLVPAVNISGQLAGPEGPASGYVMHLVPSDGGETTAAPSAGTAVTASDGAFMFIGIPAGQYVLQTTRVPRPTPPMRIDPAGGVVGAVSNATPSPGTPLLFAEMPLAVGEANVEGVVLMLREGLTVSGRVEFDGAAQRPAPARLMQIPVLLEPADGRQRPGPSAPARVQSNLRFTTTGALPGKYYIRIGGAPPGWTFRSAMLNGVDVSDAPFDLDADVSSVIVTFTDRPSDLRGTVSVPSGSPSDAAVVVFPSDSNAWRSFGTNPRRMRMGRPGPNGSFGLGALPPGDYFIVAFREEYATEWQDPAFLDQLARVAARISLMEGERKTVDVQFQDVRPGGGDLPPQVPSDPRSFVESAPDHMTGASGSGPFVPDDAPQVRDRPAEPRGASASISGVVLMDGTSTPVRRARVQLSGSEIRLQRTAITDDAGRFTVAWLPPGRYSLTVTKPAHLTTYYGARRIGRGPGAPITLAAGQQLANLSVPMQHGSSISGLVLDPFGQPYPNARVRLMQFMMRDGERTLQQVGASGTSTTDDRGLYRLYGIMPGSYVVSVVPAQINTGAELRQLSDDEIAAALNDLKQARPAIASGTPPAAGDTGQRVMPPAPRGVPAPRVPPGGRPVGYSPFFYPGTPMEHEAVTVAIGPNEDVAGIDIPVRLVPTARVEGQLLGPDGQPAQRASVQLITSTTTGITSNSVRITPDGRFLAVGVTPGRYILSARTMEAPAPRPAVNVVGPVVFNEGGPRLQLWAQQEIDVNGSDVTDIALTLSEGMTVSGRVVFEAKTLQPPADLTRVRVMLQPASVNRVAFNARPAQADLSSTFSITGVTPGRYRISASVMNLPAATPTAASGPQWMVKSAIAGGRDTLDFPLEIGPGQNVGDVVVTLTDQITEVSGTILDGKGAPVNDLAVVVFPTERALWTNSRRMRTMTRLAEGTFRFTAIPAGEYYLAVVTEIEPNTWGDPAFMEQLAAAAIKITLADGEKKVQDVRIGG